MLLLLHNGIARWVVAVTLGAQLINLTSDTHMAASGNLLGFFGRALGPWAARQCTYRYLLLIVYLYGSNGMVARILLVLVTSCYQQAPDCTTRVQ